jgi:CheY-like chemotaxis protein
MACDRRPNLVWHMATMGRMQEAPLISIVDDDEFVREATAGLMRSLGYGAETFESAQDFLEADGARRTSCLIANMQMPGMTGLELCRFLAASGDSLPTILITAYPDDRVRDRAMQAGIKCYLTKPFSEDELVNCIRSAIRDANSRSGKAGSLLAPMPRRVLQMQHVAAARLLPTREALLDELPKGGTVAEIGVAGGDFASEILRRCSVRRLHLIDSWMGERYAHTLEEVRGRFARELSIGIVEVNRGQSEDVLAGFPDFYFDWVYIDSDHGYSTTLAELSICSRKVKSGGMIAGHDFCVGNVKKRLPYGVIQAVNDFCIGNDWGHAYLTVESHGHFSFCLRAL